MRPLLVTGFEPFGGQTINASWEAVRLLPAQIAGHPVERRLLPVEFARAGDAICAFIDELQPAVVLAVGEAGGRAHLTVERVAVNLMKAEVPDNAGYAPQGVPVLEGGPAAYLTTLPLEACVEAVHAAGVPAEESDSAGLYVCNCVMYRILCVAQERRLPLCAGFVHVPYTPAQVINRKSVPFCPAEFAACGLAALLEAAVC